MRNWIAYVRQHLALPELKYDREATIIEELSLQLEDFYEEARSCGASDEEADDYARQQISDWEGLAAEISRAQTRHNKPRLENWQERAEQAATRNPGARKALADLRRDLLYGIRTLMRNPGFTFGVVMTLALGIGMNTAIFSVVNAVLFRPLPFPDPDRLVTIWTRVPERGIKRFSVSPHDFQDWRAQNHSFEEITLFETRRGTLSGGSQAEMIQYSLVSPGFFKVIGVPPLLGRTFREEENLRGNDQAVIVSYGFWQRFFGGEANALNRTLILDGKQLTVAGVMPASLSFPDSETQLWKPFGTAPDYSGSRASYTAGSVGRLRSGVKIEQAQAELDSIMADLQKKYPQSNTGMEAMVEPLHEVVIGSSRTALLLLWAIVGLVLLIACANVANLLLTRGAAREREVAIRIAVGAGSWRIVSQLLTESILLSVIGGAAGVLLAFWAVSWLPALSAGSIPRITEVGIDKGVLFFALCLSLLTGIVSGLLPAFRSVRTDLNETLKEGGRQPGSARRQGLSKALIVAEVALVLMILVGGGLVGRSFIKVTEKDPGFIAKNLLTFRVEPQVRTEYEGQPLDLFRTRQTAEREQITQFYNQLIERIDTLPGVRSAAAVSMKPLWANFWLAQIIFQDRPAPPQNEMPVAQVRVVTPGYFQTMGIPLLRGRAPSEGDKNGALRVVVISETMARRHWPGENPIGKQITTTNEPDSWLTVIGVAGDVHQAALDVESAPLLYLSLVQASSGFYKNWGMDLMVRTEGDPLELASAVRGQVSSLDGNLPVFQINTMEEVLADSIAERRFSMLLLTTFSIVALTLAAVGIYGVIAYSVNQRSHEIGIRMALGAHGGNILRLVIGQGLLLTIAGLAIGTVGAFLLTRYLKGLLFEVTVTDPFTFVGVSLLLTVVALLACYIPARRATKVDPMIALRYE